ncbi:cysteine-rich receptor-like protein kinase 11 [Corylus avellana]|uniref:cysteine-rich receptor-like protein kinase 11 n=1 Tax=Corylus avellana TaxID=13451 RepID=UPI00286B5D04|nr:cysteine-rich receptor-like protein kinase 11 [Corylus avellana]
MLRYSDTNFFGVEQTSPELLAWNTIGNTTSPDEANFGALALMNGLIDEALGTDMLFKAGNRPVGKESEVRYGLVQCTRDINTTSCSNCLGQLMNDANQCCQQKQGWRILAPSCNIRYENYLFFQKPPVPPSPQPVPAAPQPPPDNGGGGGKNTTKIVIITLSSITVVAALLGFWYSYSSFDRRKRKEEGDMSQASMLGNWEASHTIGSIQARDQDNSGEMHYFNLSTMQAATNNFSDANKLGEGGFGPVYKGMLINGKEIAVKRLSMKSKQGLEEFKNEVLLIVKLQHKHLVRLLGCCVEGGEKLLVYE